MDSYGPITGHTFLAWIETNDGLVAIDSGWDVAWDEPYEGSDLEAITLAAEGTGKPLTHILFTHDHPDHRANLPLLRDRWAGVEVFAHRNSRIEGVNRFLEGGETLTLGGVTIQTLATPGHSQQRDELCYLLPDFRLLFSGDVAQPQGPSYALVTGHSPVPFFYYGDEYHRTLELLIKQDVGHMRSGHGDFLGPEQTRQWLRVTLATVERIEALAVTYVERYPAKDAAWIAELVYDQIVEERHFGMAKGNQRKRTRVSEDKAETEYERYDLPGILWFVQAAQSY
jgi:glyoxylase-like metal-dependent hydrolase (beta-lactamase superfamily II)